MSEGGAGLDPLICGDSAPAWKSELKPLKRAQAYVSLLHSSFDCVCHGREMLRRPGLTWTFVITGDTRITSSGSTQIANYVSKNQKAMC